MFQMLGVFAEFEREVIRERINAGIARARLKGTKSGAPIGRAPTPPHVVTAIRKTLAKGTGIIKTAKLHGVGVGTMQRIKQLWLECLDTLDRLYLIKLLVRTAISLKKRIRTTRSWQR